ncbi:MAG: tRNA guanosine(34) transglycosylase Tgt [Rickettsiales bacterium]|jgi:queuine tRNA-ribosyltransferase|nr:tRNA guanosine(34) transglycosylase Tgt [Rickettsiales bacterium]
MSLKFNLMCNDGNARRGSVETAHGTFQTPAFMAVGTAATVKAMTMDMVDATGTEVILGNTYHLMLRPGGDLVESLGGLHKFSGWKGPILTDSGGFQIKSLAGWGCSGEASPVSKTDGGLVKRTEEGVEFTSHIDGGQKHFLTPEKSIQIQHQLDSNITMAFDECLPYPVEHDVAKANVERVTRWAKRSFDAFVDRPGYGIFGIVQGSVFKDLRDISARDLTRIPFDGFAIGSLTQGEPYEIMLEIIAHTTAQLPTGKPRYLMGAGTPIDILGAVERGIDMFDCVMPTRAGRTAQAFTRHGTMNMRNARFKDDAAPLDSKCGCPACRGASALSRAYIHHLIKADEILGAMLLTQHNLWFYQDMMRDIRDAIEHGEFQKFKKDFIEKYTENK